MHNLFLIIFIIQNLHTISPFMVEGISMEPNLHDHAFFLINDNLESANDLSRGDVIVFSFDGNFFYVKRIIGEPGDVIRMGGDTVAIRRGEDFQVLPEPYLRGADFDYGADRYFMVPENEFFVLGDNRDHSKDSRAFDYPFVGFDQVYGKYIFP